ncbi:MAG: sulfite exporter TauE/SafE family protein [Clostridia bacterium]|nr:sulfite exporter TauE/SafE family protein [Clostridia bacterium]
MKKVNSSRPNMAFWLLLVGVAAGMLNGLLGAGGGIIVVYAVTRFKLCEHGDKNGAFSTALCVMLPVSVVSCIIYAVRGHTSLQGFGVFILPAVIGGALGGIFLGRIKPDILKKAFAGLIVISGIILIMR